MRRRIYTHEEYCVICHRTEYDEDVSDPDADIIGVNVEKVVCPQCAEAVGFVKDNLENIKAILRHFTDDRDAVEIQAPAAGE